MLKKIFQRSAKKRQAAIIYCLSEETGVSGLLDISADNRGNLHHIDCLAFF
jgi:hypothetical protein